ncbi:type I protein arginine methyltransferase [Malassezia yamatoensis]|uniref:Type I protein arginine methyltransferase n=1 Tax=Malassezia yamatoensis TaxID=253288 RepID=A0AAJ5YWY3_9BASI|nr:type I protein arginine methyltransferase [Malassezia yamatoensis]
MLHGLGLLRQRYEQYTNQSASSPEQTVQILSEKISDASLSLEDRRAAMLSLRALIRDHASLVCGHAFDALLKWIKNPDRDNEMLRAGVEACLTLCQSDSGKLAQRKLLDEQDGIANILRFVAPQYAFYTRFAVLQLVGLMLEHHRTEFQDRMLTAPGGSGLLLQCLEAAPTSSTEILRNEALLLMPLLVSRNVDLQKVFAFEGAFERLLDIVAQEGRIEGGVVAQDALTALEALLIDNASNQNYFRETLSIPLLAPLFFFPPPLPPNADDAARQEFAQHRDAFLLQEWDEEKLSNALLLIRCIRHLVDGHADDHRENQRAIANSGMTDCLIQLVFASLAPSALKAYSLHLLAAILRHSRQNQDLLRSTVVTPVALLRRSAREDQSDAEPMYELAWQSPQPAMMCMIALVLRGPGATESKAQAQAVRTAALAAFHALVEENIEVRMTLLHAFVAAPAPDQNHGNSNQLLLDTIAHLPTTSLTSSSQNTRFDASQYLYASFLLSSLLHGSETCKAFARSIYTDESGRCVATAKPQHLSTDEPPTTLLHLLIGNVAMATRELEEAVRRERAGENDAQANTSEDWTRIIAGYLILLGHWLWQSPDTVADLVNESANFQVLLQPVAQSHGVDTVIQALAAFVLGELYEFNPLVSDQEGVLTRSAMHSIIHARIGLDAFTSRMTRLKTDPRFAQVGPDVYEQYVTYADPSKSVSPLSEPQQLWFSWLFVDFWKEHYVHAQKAMLVDPQATTSDASQTSAELLDARQQVASLQSELQRVKADAACIPGLRADLAKAEQHSQLASQLRDQLEDMRKVLDATKLSLDEAHIQIAELQSNKSASALQQTPPETHSSQSKELSQEAIQLQAELSKAREELSSLQHKHNANTAEIDNLRTNYERQLREVQAQHSNDLQRLRDEHAAEIQRLHAQHAAETERLRGAQLDNRTSKSAQDTNTDLAQENEDLLVLLDELSTKHKRNKERMRMQGWDVSDDDDEDDDVEL